MERQNQFNFVLFFSLIIALGLISFSFCLAAEFRKSEKKDLRFDEKLCYLHRSPAFGFGIAALIYLFAGQVIGNLFICRKFSRRDHRSGCDNKIKRPSIASILLVFSWITFGIAVILVSVATSMSRSQPFGEGWLDGECYIVKSGVYIGSGILAVLTLGLTLGSTIVIIRQKRVEEDRKVHAQNE
ncbi:uncharacterized protein LOC111404284 [Olea europaea var. sylvestris]|uniref:Uncharacterized protein LOC111404284 n=1 Tax=Olea europaea subsp. europaea TaxID=158383 RepID=A0A8S0RGU8_OLEEU|nr:uncharacterized protein LOC111404284 [Olea europaea var. sylvestris]CAA2978630.1 uncharacterized protein LOC111404284 [Olea europaea subsp. europaea]